jgi:prepilin-type N-terminal cleavage/methylation domain-containing protein
MRASHLRRISTGPRHPAFTLIEVLVVVAIIAMLIAILLPSLAAARRQARTVVCSTNLHTIGQALMYYAQASKDDMPAGYNVDNTGKIIYVDETKKITAYNLNTFEFLYPYVQKLNPKQAVSLDSGTKVWAIKAPTFTCPDDLMQHTTGQRWQKMPDGTMAQTEFDISYGANLNAMVADIADAENTSDTGRVKGAAKLSSIRAPSQLVTYLDNGDDGNIEIYWGGWVFYDCKTYGQNQCAIEVHHKVGDNFLFLDGHVSFYNANSQKPQYGLPPFPAAWIPNWRGPASWRGPAWVKDNVGFLTPPTYHP